MRSCRAFVALVACSCWAVAGCSADGSPRSTAAGQAAARFAQVVTGQPDAACALLAPDTRQELEDSSGPCPQGIADVKLPDAGRVLSVDVFGLDAIVRLEHDTMFLALFDAGWRVTAAGCTPQEEDRPYDCHLKGA
jgi:hypothetical protein